MLSKITCSKGFIYWLDLDKSIIQMLCTNCNADNKKYALILSHPAMAVEGGEVDYVMLTDGMPLDDLKRKYSAMLPTDIALDFTK